MSLTWLKALLAVALFAIVYAFGPYDVANYMWTMVVAQTGMVDLATLVVAALKWLPIVALIIVLISLAIDFTIYMAGG